MIPPCQNPNGVSQGQSTDRPQASARPPMDAANTRPPRGSRPYPAARPARRQVRVSEGRSDAPQASQGSAGPTAPRPPPPTPASMMMTFRASDGCEIPRRTNTGRRKRGQQGQGTVAAPRSRGRPVTTAVTGVEGTETLAGPSTGRVTHYGSNASVTRPSFLPTPFFHFPPPYPPLTFLSPSPTQFFSYTLPPQSTPFALYPPPPPPPPPQPSLNSLSFLPLPQYPPVGFVHDNMTYDPMVQLGHPFQPSNIVTTSQEVVPMQGENFQPGAQLGQQWYGPSQPQETEVERADRMIAELIIGQEDWQQSDPGLLEFQGNFNDFLHEIDPFGLWTQPAILSTAIDPVLSIIAPVENLALEPGPVNETTTGVEDTQQDPVEPSNNDADGIDWDFWVKELFPDSGHSCQSSVDQSKSQP
ncbi:hypothetical protein TREMEDRAFT_59045 [Tremella mesenterica DSM 1558]|uniref:uncharacterized protein n=1 Tax=Tremella mesenterica (strain ATCC 24925 / CBS 8224 / DSM 1558 / NBRC 9311 / NRRL Y-6157 / RJB 2259-6 / UBC 559-6) TaxID=578456 RepID=UPI0003F4A4BF|nr:uncharacterized protein TREMEDRAFT_59045 [Tremella mesenterica DSM 1558]EIW72882.1 hypothetical protein TREMEDRAFT_59045 [Tremella mesenterica DSM 1558]